MHFVDFRFGFLVKKLYIWPNCCQKAWKYTQIKTTVFLLIWILTIVDQHLTIYTVFLQGIRIWGQKTPNFGPRREKSRNSNFVIKLLFEMLDLIIKLEFRDFSLLGLKFGVFWPQIRIPCEKLYIWSNVGQKWPKIQSN